MKKVLVLGVTGMLGSMVFDYLSGRQDYDISGTQRTPAEKDNIHSFDAENGDIVDLLDQIKPDYIINCIGIINIYCRDDDQAGVLRAIKVNALFPHRLAAAAQNHAKVIQIATDCVFSGKKGNYPESDPHDALDAYGKTKSLGEIKTGNFLNIRCSIIGPERKNKHSLLEWFLNQPPGSELKGYAHHRWNGITTLQFARLCEEIIDQGDEYFDKLISASHVHHYLPNGSVNKFELLNILNEVFGRDQTINKVTDIGPAIDRTLATGYGLLAPVPGKYDLKQAVSELKQYIEKSDFYKIET